MSKKHKADWNRFLCITNYRDFALFAEEHGLLNFDLQTRVVTRESTPLNDRMDELEENLVPQQVGEYRRFLQNQTSFVFTRINRLLRSGVAIRGSEHEEFFDAYFQMAVGMIESFIGKVPCSAVIFKAICVLTDFVNLLTGDYYLDPYFAIKVNPKLLSTIDIIPEPKYKLVPTDAGDRNKLPIIVSGSRIGVSLGEKQLFIKANGDKVPVKTWNLQRLFMLWKTEDIHLVENELVETENFRKKIEDYNKTGDLIDVVAHFKEQRVGSRWGNDHKTILISRYRRHLPEKSA